MMLTAACAIDPSDMQLMCNSSANTTDLQLCRVALYPCRNWQQCWQWLADLGNVDVKLKSPVHTGTFTPAL